MNSQEQLLLDDLSLLCEHAIKANNIISLAPIIAEYAETVLNEPSLDPILKSVRDQCNADHETYYNLAKMAINGINEASEKISAYIKNNNMSDQNALTSDITWLQHEMGLDAASILQKYCAIK